MAINAYCGVMGSGKSYEVVSGPLLNAVALGRRVVTNIDGINESAIHDYLVKKRKLEREKLGAVVMVPTEDFLKPSFFPVEEEGDAGAVVKPGFVQPGDFVVVDEAWKLWKTGVKIPPDHMAFFRMHRHFVHEKTAVACDVALMIQAISGLHRDIKDVIELSFVMVKLKSLGLSKGYRVEMYETAKQNSKTRIGTFVRRYKAEIFPLYRSYAGGQGKEAQIDKRQNILANKRLWLIVAVMMVMPIVSVRFIWSFFHRAANGTTAVAASPVAASSGSAGAAGSISPSGAAAGSFKRAFSEDWRIVGSYTGPGRSWVVLADSAGRLRMESPSMFQNTGVVRVGAVDGEQVSTFSGAKPSSSGAGGSASAGLIGVAK